MDKNWQNLNSSLENFSQKFDKSVINPKFKIISNGFYHIYLKNWFLKFSPKNILLLSTDKLITNPAVEFQKFEKFFNITNFFTKNMFQKPQNSTFYCIEKSEVEIFYEKEIKFPFPNAQFQKDPSGKSFFCTGKNKGKTRGKKKSKSLENSIFNLKTFYKNYNLLLYNYTNEHFWK